MLIAFYDDNGETIYLFLPHILLKKLLMANDWRKLNKFMEMTYHPSHPYIAFNRPLFFYPLFGED